MYSELRSEHIHRTTWALGQRIEERFPGAGLGKVCSALEALAEDVDEVVDRLRRPIWVVRIAGGIGIAVVLTVTFALGGVTLREASRGPGSLPEFLQAVEAAINDVVLIGLAVYFLATLESRIKRRLALRSLHRLRSLVHIVDMHQLAKDPEHLLSPGHDTRSSPERRFSRFEMSRYLDYCSELLSLTSKLAALHVERFSDPVVLEAVNDVEQLSAALSGKIWQKIMILDRTRPEIVESHAVPAAPAF